MARLGRLVFAAALLAAGCASGGRWVRVARYAPATPEQLRRARALSSVYVAVEEPAPVRVPLEGLIGRFAQATADAAASRLPAAELAAEAARALRRAGSPAAIFRVVRPGEDDPFPARLKTASTLRLRAGRMRLEETKNEEQARERPGPKKGQTLPATGPTWKRRALVEIRAELSARGRALESFSETAEVGEDRSKEPSGTKWLGQVTHRLAAGAAEAVARRLALPASSRRRRAQVPDEGWRAEWNRALAAEERGRDGEAEALYRKARAAAEGDAEAAAIGWDALFAELAAGASAQAEPWDDSWFKPRLAVLPFSDETTSVDGPAAVRLAAHRLLAAGGYAAAPVEEVDLALRERGFTDGGQLEAAATPPRTVAGWLGSERLLSGHLEYYQLLPAGVVAGDLKLWDAAAGTTTWTAKASAAMVDDRALTRAELKRLTGQSWSTLMLLPAAETLRFVRSALGGLPQQASAD